MAYRKFCVENTSIVNDEKPVTGAPRRQRPGAAYEIRTVHDFLPFSLCHFLHIVVNILRTYTLHNSLPDDITSASSLSVFRKKLKTKHTYFGNHIRTLFSSLLWFFVAIVVLEVNCYLGHVKM